MSGFVHFSPLFTEKPKFTPTLFEVCSRIVRRSFWSFSTRFFKNGPLLEQRPNDPAFNLGNPCTTFFSRKKKATTKCKTFSTPVVVRFFNGFVRVLFAFVR